MHDGWSWHRPIGPVVKVVRSAELAIALTYRANEHVSPELARAIALTYRASEHEKLCMAGRSWHRPIGPVAKVVQSTGLAIALALYRANEHASPELARAKRIDL